MFNKKMRIATAIVGVVATSAALTGCSGSGGGSTEKVDTSNASGTVNYWLWDDNQKPAYQACADDFHKANPKITVNVSQYAWDTYWSKITTGFVSGTAPDVFTDHIAYYPQFAKDKVLSPLDDYVKKDNINVNQYQPGLADLWVAKDGHRYGLPKDFDTTAYFYNKDMISSAGISSTQLDSMTWNPTDGGTFEKIIAHLSVDKNGKRGDQAGFDPNNVKVYGLGLDGGSGGYVGQTQWAPYALSLANNWYYMNNATWGTKWNYNDSQFQAMITWFSGLIKKGYMPPLKAITGQDQVSLLGAGKYAMTLAGDWVTGEASGLKNFKLGIAPTPIGPSGKRASMFNGLGDSIWAKSKNQAADAKWVEYLGSSACQDVVGKAGVVFPAIPSATALAEQAFKAKGVDMSSFLIHVQDKTTKLYPLSQNAAKIGTIMQPAMDSIFEGKTSASSLSSANNQVNALFNQ